VVPLRRRSLLQCVLYALGVCLFNARLAHAGEPPELRDTTAKTQVPAVSAASEAATSVSLATVPLASYAPETSVAGGLLFVLFKDVKTPGERPSNFSALGLATARRQLIFEVAPELYLDQQRVHIWHKLEYQHYPDRFFGVGNDVPNRSVSYTRRMLRGRLLAERRMFDGFWLGVYAEAMSVRPEYGGAGERFEAVPGRAGGLALGAGPQLAWDTRDSALAASSGTLLSLSASIYPQQLGGEYAFWRITADAREVFGLGRGHVLALRALLQRNSERVPYYMMAQLGGPDVLRGYYQGRYRDRALGLAEFEYRTPFLWRLGAAAFGGVGRVSDDITGLRLERLHPSLGAGLRFNVAKAERLNLRADAGLGSDGPALYVGVGEAF
jgi:hypothetical protein